MKEKQKQGTQTPRPGNTFWDDNPKAVIDERAPCVYVDSMQEAILDCYLEWFDSCC